MKAFENLTEDGNEPAIKRGQVVPEDAVNLAFAKTPKLSPKENVVIVDTSRIVEENVLNPTHRRKLYYANSMGVLVDASGNVVVGDEHPAVTDVFTVDEDWINTPGNEYTDASILPFVHTSRHFHLDSAGLTMGTELLSLETENVKVLDAHGREYLDGAGRRRYRIQITPAYSSSESESWAYRILAYVDTDENESLYLSYNKVDVGTNGLFKNFKLNHKELLNPLPVFDYRPEESEVVDPANRKQKWYSTKPVSLKEQVLNKPHPNVDGYKVYVPKKAVGDPRIFQLFRWRIVCDFVQDFTVDLTRNQVIRAGIVITDSDTSSRSPYALLNLQRSNYNATGVVFQNPKQSAHGAEEQQKASYWYVNMDTDDLSEYDLLLWSPSVPQFDFAPYTSKMEDFTGTKGGTIFVDTNTYTKTYGLANWDSAGVTPSNGAFRSANENLHYGLADFDHYDLNHELLSGQDTLGGWQVITSANNDEGNAMTYIHQLFDPGYTQVITDTNAAYSTIISVDNNDHTSTYPVVVYRKANSGNHIFSTYGILFTCSALFSHISPTLISENLDATLYNDPNHSLYINSTVVEGAMKFLFNVALLAVKGRTLDDSDEKAYSSNWQYTTKWKSSWVINAGNDILSDSEKAEHDFSLQPKDLHAEVPDPTPVYKRRLANYTVEQLFNQELEAVLSNPAIANRVNTAERSYRIEITNPQVHIGSKVIETDYPYAWTEAYTPRFEVPVELGAHVIKDEVDIQGRRGVIADYDEGTYSYYTYPDKPYSGQVFTAYSTTEETTVRESLTWTAFGTANETVTITTTTPARYDYSTSDVTLSWYENGNRSWYESTAPFEFGLQQTSGIATWQEHNYYNTAFGTGIRNWPFWGLVHRYDLGDGPDPVIAFIQAALNKFLYFGFYSTGAGYLPEDGKYGSRTKQAVTDFQSARGAQFIDGVVDAETWYLIGNQILRGTEFLGFQSGGRTDHYQYFDWPYGRIVKSHISDNTTTPYAKRSWFNQSPAVIWELFMVRFNQQYDIHGVTVIPYMEGVPEDMMVRSIDVRTGIDLVNYNADHAIMNNLPYRPRDAEELYIPIGPYRGDTVVVGVGQDRGGGYVTRPDGINEAWYNTKMLGVRDIRAHTRVTTSTYVGPVVNITHQTHNISLNAGGTIDVDSFKDVTLQAQAVGQYGGVLSNVVWTSVVTNNPNVVASIDANGLITFRNILVDQNIEDHFKQGPVFPDTAGTYYSMDENGRLNPVPETGYVSKADGIKLLCDANKNPVGFPAMPNDVGANEFQQHYVKLTLTSKGTDASVSMAFYDRAHKEFITNAAGQPEMSYIEYIQRGPNNVYIAVISEFQLTGEAIVPVDSDAPRLPFRWAMPVYGVYTRSGSKITLESLPHNLGPHDVWPVAVRDGNFNRSVRIRTRAEGFIAGYLGTYQGTTLAAHYSIPEADIGGYSTIYGPPNADVVGEEPLILDDNLIQVRQAPILAIKMPNVIPSNADPVRAVFTVYKRATRNAAWVALPWSEISDYNLSIGEIFLKTSLQSNDAGLLKVDYTTTRRHYQFKKFGSQLLNLNSYSGHSRDLLGEGIYIYIVPEYVKAPNGVVIPESVVDRTLRFTTSPTIFDPVSPQYDPLAIQLGVIYMSAALDPRDVALLDTRRRGGGAKDSASVDEVVRLVKEASTYWDIGHAAGGSYQKGGYVIVRLPAELKTYFSEGDVMDVIKRNMTAGVGFKVEDLEGNDW